MTRHLLSATAAFSLVLLAACNRPDNLPTPRIVCHREATYLALGHTNALRGFYNAAGQIARVAPDGASMISLFEFVHKDELILRNGASNTRPDTVRLNAAGLMLSRHFIFDTSGGGQGMWTRYEYAGDELQRSMSGISMAGVFYPGDTTKYFWSEGNMVRSEAGSNVIFYEHYTDRPNTATTGPDLLAVQSIFSFGAPSVRNRHLVKGWKSGAEEVAVRYVFDSEERVSKIDFSDTLTGRSGMLQYHDVCE